MSLGSLGACQCGPGSFLSPPVGFYGSRRWRGICGCSLCVGCCGLGVGLGPCEVGIGLTVGLDRAGLVWHNRRRSVDWCSSHTMVGPRRRVGVVSGCRAVVLLCGLLTGWVDGDGCTRAGVRWVGLCGCDVQIGFAWPLRWVGMEDSLGLGGDGWYGWSTLRDECCDAMVVARSVWRQVVVRADRLGG